MSTDGDLPVIFVSGKGRSGSTIATMVLGEMPGVFAAGEVRFLWERGMLEQRRCGCGRRFSDCELWGGVIARMSDADDDTPDAAAVARWHREVFRWAAMPRLLAGRRGTRSWDHLHHWAEATSMLYRAIADQTDARVLVDSSKWPTDPGLLGLVPGIRPVIVQLVRDPRAVAHSWGRRRTQYDLDEPREMDRYGPVHSSVSWLARNAVVEAVARRGRAPRLVLRYEDFVADPAAAIAEISAIAEVELDPASILDGHTVQLSPNHTVAGNPTRFAQGSVELRPDDEWRAKLSTPRRVLVSLLTAPMLHRYGYRFRSATSASTSSATG